MKTNKRERSSEPFLPIPAGHLTPAPTPSPVEPSVKRQKTNDDEADIFADCYELTKLPSISDALHECASGHPLKENALVAAPILPVYTEGEKQRAMITADFLSCHKETLVNLFNIVIQAGGSSDVVLASYSQLLPKNEQSRLRTLLAEFELLSPHVAVEAGMSIEVLRSINYLSEVLRTSGQATAEQASCQVELGQVHGVNMLLDKKSMRELVAATLDIPYLRMPEALPILRDARLTLLDYRAVHPDANPESLNARFNLKVNLVKRSAEPKSLISRVYNCLSRYNYATDQILQAMVVLAIADDISPQEIAAAKQTLGVQTRQDSADKKVHDYLLSEPVMVSVFSRRFDTILKLDDASKKARASQPNA